MAKLLEILRRKRAMAALEVVALAEEIFVLRRDDSFVVYDGAHPFGTREESFSCLCDGGLCWPSEVDVVDVDGGVDPLGKREVGDGLGHGLGDVGGRAETHWEGGETAAIEESEQGGDFGVQG